MNNQELEEHETDVNNQKEVPEDSKTPESRKKRIFGSIIEFGVYLAIIVLCVTVVPRYVVQRTIVDGRSMMNTLKDQENLLVEKVSYHFSDPDRYDIIVFYPKGRDYEDYYIKRVIGLPGETVQIIGSTIYIDGKELKENYGKDPITSSGVAAEPIKLADDEFFVMGDNRTVSEDSRSIGPVKKKNIEGRAILRIYPFSEFGTLD